MLHYLQVRDWRAHGLAAGIAGSGVAAAQVAARNELGAAFAALGIGLNGLLTAILVPVLVRLWHSESSTRRQWGSHKLDF